MPNTMIILFTALLATGCGKKAGSDPSAKLTELKEAMCKCKPGDAACANKVVDEQKKWGEEQAKTVDANAKPDPELAKKLEPIMTEYSKCMTAALTPAAKPAPAPPAAPAIPADTETPQPITCDAGKRLGPSDSWWCWAKPETATLVSAGGGDDGNKYTWQVGAEIVNGGETRQKAEDAYAEMEKEARTDGAEPVSQGQTPGGEGKYIIFKTGSQLAITARLPLGPFVAYCRVRTDLAKPDKAILDICRRATPHVP